MQKNTFMRKCIWIGISGAVLVLAVLIILAAKAYQAAERKPERVLAKRVEEVAQSMNCDVTVSKHDVAGQNHFSYLYGRLQELCDSYPDTQVVCYIDGETSMEGLARVEIGNPGKSNVHYLYLMHDDALYEICGNMNKNQWNECLSQLFLKEDLFLGDMRVDGVILKNDAFNFVYDEELTGLTTRAIYRFGSYEADADSYESSADEFVLVSRSFPGGEERIEETCVRKTEGLPDYEDEREMLSYFREQYPDMVSYSVYETLSKIVGGNYCRIIKENEVVHCFFYWEGNNYEITSWKRSGGDVTMPYRMRNGTKVYAAGECMRWVKRKDGSSLWSDGEEGSYCLWQDVGEEKELAVQIQPAELTPDGGRIFEIQVYWEGDEEPFQRFRTEGVAQDYSRLGYDFDGDGLLDMLEKQMPFFFADYNADGCLEINCLSQARPQKVFRYFWSPSQQQFVQGPKELEDYFVYTIDKVKRRLCVAKRPLDDNECYLYQWSNEMDCELIKTFKGTWTESKNEYLVHIVNYKDGEEQVLMDYEYDIEQYPYYIEKWWYGISDNCFMELFEDDLVWEKNIQIQDSEESCTLYYAQKDLRNSENYEEHLWVLDENTKLVKRLFWKSEAPYLKISWEDSQALVIQYSDGSEKRWTLPEILKDPAREIYEWSIQIDYTVKESPLDASKYDAQTDKIYKDAYYKAVSSQVPVRGLDSEKVYLKGYFGDYFMESTDEEYLEELIKDTKFYYMDFDGDGLPELIMDVMGAGLHILKYLPEEDVVEIFFGYYRMPYYNLLGAGQLYYHNPCTANQDIWKYDIVDADGKDSLVVYFWETYAYDPADDDGWIATYWVSLDDEFGMVKVDEESYQEITKNFFAAIKNAPSEMEFEEIFGKERIDK